MQQRIRYIAGIAILALVILVRPVMSQSVPEDLRWEALYEFMDELAAEQVITLHTSVKPYAKKTHHAETAGGAAAGVPAESAHAWRAALLSPQLSS